MAFKDAPKRHGLSAKGITHQQSFGYKRDDFIKLLRYQSNLDVPTVYRDRFGNPKNLDKIWKLMTSTRIEGKHKEVKFPLVERSANLMDHFYGDRIPSAQIIPDVFFNAMDSIESSPTGLATFVYVISGGDPTRLKDNRSFRESLLDAMIHIVEGDGFGNDYSTKLNGLISLLTFNERLHLLTTFMNNEGEGRFVPSTFKEFFIGLSPKNNAKMLSVMDAFTAEKKFFTTSDTRDRNYEERMCYDSVRDFSKIANIFKVAYLLETDYEDGYGDVFGVKSMMYPTKPFKKPEQLDAYFDHMGRTPHYPNILAGNVHNKNTETKVNRIFRKQSKVGTKFKNEMMNNSIRHIISMMNDQRDKQDNRTEIMDKYDDYTTALTGYTISHPIMNLIHQMRYSQLNIEYYEIEEDVYKQRLVFPSFESTRLSRNNNTGNDYPDAWIELGKKYYEEWLKKTVKIAKSKDISVVIKPGDDFKIKGFEGYYKEE